MKKSLVYSRAILVALVSGLLFTHPIYAQKITFSDAFNKAGFTLKQETRAGVSIGYSVESFHMVSTEINGRGMTNIELPGVWLPMDAGAPNLPGSGRMIAIPEGSQPVLRVISQRTETYRNLDIAPAPRIPLDTDRGPLEYPTRTDIYSNNAFYPAQPVTLSTVSQIRGVDFVMLGITPFQYNPVTKELIVYRDLEVEIEFQGGTGQFGEERLRSRFWDPILEDVLFNRQSLPVIDYGKRAIANRSNDGCEYLIITANSPEYLNWANEIRSFRIKQGVTTEIRTLTDIGGNSAPVIENFIDDVYANWDPVPSAILIMGDYGTNANTNVTSPIWDSYCVSDNIYGDIDEDDLPDIVMARMVGNNNTELETFVTKFMNYELNPPTSPAFYDHPITALGWQTERWFQICSETIGGYFKNVQGKNPVRINEIYAGNPSSDPWSTATNTQVVLDEFGPNGLGYIPASPQQLGGWSGGDATDINNAINAGSFLLQHRDHGEEQGWGEPQYSNGNINGLTNTDLTFIFSINCLTGKYNWSSECFSEKFHRYRYNGVNSGALGVTCASEVSYSFVNDTYVWGLYDNLWPDFMPDYGSNPPERGLLPAFGNAAGKYFLAQSSWPSNPQNKEVTYHLFHHFGDAFQTLYSEVPQNLTIVHDGIILAGLEEFTISADAGATICLTVGDEIISLATATGAPQTLVIDAQEVGTIVTLTITKTNYFRHVEEIEVIPAEGAYCLYGTHTVVDAGGGNGNGLVDYNETVSLNLAMRNVGLNDGENVDVSINTLDPFIELMDNTEFYGIIPAGQSVTIENGFSFYAAENTPDQHQALFNVVATNGTDTWTSHFMLNINAPNLNINALTIDDSMNGNGDGILDPGEQVTMTINYSNTGHATAYDVDVHLEGQSGFVEVLNPDQNFESIGFLGVFNKSFDVVIDPEAPEGIPVDFMNEVSMGIYYGEKCFNESIRPMIEDFETGNFNKYNWQFSGNQPWTASNQYPYQGMFSGRSGTISDNQTSELKITYEVMKSDSVIFIRKVSSEAGDKLKFYIGSELMGEWSGTTEGWRREAFAVAPGMRTFKWVYAKNNSGSGGSDRAWLDNIQLPSEMALTVWAGPDGAICSDADFQIQEAYGTDYATITWSTAGTGSFNDNTQILPVYTPGPEDIDNGSVMLTLTLTNNEGDIVTDEMTLTFTGTPDAPQTIEGPNYVDLLETVSSDYLTEGVPDIFAYAWYISPAEAGTIEGSNHYAAVTWNPAFLGTANITVAAIGECGEGDKSQAFEVTVDNTVGIGDNAAKAVTATVYPNPGNGWFNIRITGIQSGNHELKLTNVIGQTIRQENINISGQMTLELDLTALPDGIYFLKVAGTVHKIVKE